MYAVADLKKDIGVQEMARVREDKILESHAHFQSATKLNKPYLEVTRASQKSRDL